MRRRGTAVLALLVLAGCGESPPLSRSEYAAEGNEVCREVAGRWKDLDVPLEEPVSEDEYVDFVAWDMRMGNELGGEVLDRVGALRPPGELEDDAGRMLDALETVLDGLDAYAAAVEIRNDAELERLEEEVDDEDLEVFRREARALGLNVCAKGLFLSSWRAAKAPQAPQEGLDMDQLAPSPSLSGAGK